MAKGNAVWGIDIGQAALKALRCQVGEDGETLEAVAFDFIEYPKLLSQPDTDARELVRDALKQFLSRNSVRGDKVAISVAGQSGLARFIKLPPVESKKVPDIVKYEARQQIPFELDDVIWDYQEMPGGSEDEGVKLETEVGLFAMKRDQVFRAVDPYDDAGIELDIVQLTPLCIYNFVVHDLLPDISGEEYDPEDPPPSLVVVSMGTDTTDLVITNGFRVWQRSVPIGGNHFTRQLTKELKLTFAKAEHLKKNARQAENAKEIIQAMRPVYSDLATEIQRSLSFFQSIDRNAKFGGMVCLGNAVKLPGLQQYLAKNLELKTAPIDRFRKLAGSDVVSAPSFKENVLSFAACYGLCLQGENKAALQTTLLPREILVSRLIRRKKPWAAASAAVIMLACAILFLFAMLPWWQSHPDHWDGVMRDATNLEKTSRDYKTKDQNLQNQFAYLKGLSQEVIGPAEGRLLWPELLKAINDQLPYDTSVEPGQFSELPIGERPNVHIQSVDAKYYADLSQWYTEPLQAKYEETLRNIENMMLGRDIEEPSEAPPAEGEEGAEGAATAETPGEQREELVPTAEPPTGSGWVIQLTGFHLHNANPPNYRSQYLTEAFLCKFVAGTPYEGVVTLPTLSAEGEASAGEMVQFKLHELGISHPMLVSTQWNPDHQIDNPDYSAGGEEENGQPMGAAAGGSSDVPARFDAPSLSFVIQFCWQETRLSERLEQRELEAQQEQAGPVATLNGEGGL